jgi:hypothetical protein
VDEGKQFEHKVVECGERPSPQHQGLSVLRYGHFAGLCGKRRRFTFMSSIGGGVGAFAFSKIVVGHFLIGFYESRDLEKDELVSTLATLKKVI